MASSNWPSMVLPTLNAVTPNFHISMISGTMTGAAAPAPATSTCAFSMKAPFAVRNSMRSRFSASSFIWIMESAATSILNARSGFGASASGSCNRSGPTNKASACGTACLSTSDNCSAAEIAISVCGLNLEHITCAFSCRMSVANLETSACIARSLMLAYWPFSSCAPSVSFGSETPRTMSEIPMISYTCCFCCSAARYTASSAFAIGVRSTTSICPLSPFFSANAAQFFTGIRLPFAPSVNNLASDASAEAS